MTPIAPAWRALRERSVRPAGQAGGPGDPTTPMPRLTDVVHSVTATFDPAGWTLRFGSAGPPVVVRRLAEADATARALVAACLGLPAGALRVRIVPDRDSVVALRRSGRRPPWWRRSADRV